MILLYNLIISYMYFVSKLRIVSFECNLQCKFAPIHKFGQGRVLDRSGLVFRHSLFFNEEHDLKWHLKTLFRIKRSFLAKCFKLIGSHSLQIIQFPALINQTFVKLRIAKTTKVFIAKIR